VEKKRWIVIIDILGIFGGCKKKEVAEVRETLSLRIEHIPITEHIGPGEQEVMAKVETSQGITPEGVKLYYKVKDGNYQSIVMKPFGSPGYYSASIPFYPRGTEIFYYLEVTDIRGLKAFLPSDLMKPYPFTFKGKVTGIFLHAHIGSMFLALALWLLSAYYAFRSLRFREEVSKVVKMATIALVLFFLGGFPLGWIVAYQAFGQPWTGFPLGFNITDNKTLLIFLYWLVTLFLVKDTLFSKETPKNLISGRAFSILVLIGTISTIIIYFIPHSAFSPLKILWKAIFP